AAPQPRRPAAPPAQLQRRREGRPGRLPQDAERREIHQRPEVRRPVRVNQAAARTKEQSMRNGMLWLTCALAVTLAGGGRGLAEPPGDRGRPPGPLVPPSGLERAVDDLQLSERKRETALADVRAYEDDVRRLTALANSALLLKMKAILSEEEYRQLVEA